MRVRDGTREVPTWVRPRRGSQTAGMEPATVRRLLSPLHAAVLELEEAGHNPTQIATLLDVEPSAVGPLLRVAHAKLAELEMLEIGSPPRSPTRTGRRIRP